MKYLLIILLLSVGSAQASKLDDLQKLQRAYDKTLIGNNIYTTETINVKSYKVTGVIYPKAYIYTNDLTYVTYDSEVINSLPNISDVNVKRFIYGAKVIAEISSL